MSKQKQQQPITFEINKVDTYNECFEGQANFLSRMFFIWTHRLIKKGSQKHLDLPDLSDLKQNQEPKPTHEQFSGVYRNWQPTKPKKIMASFRKYLGPTFILAGILATISNLLQFSGPIVIEKVLLFLQSSDPNIYDGIKYISFLVLCYLLRTIIMQHSMHFVNLSCIRVLNSANSLIYHKILNLSSASRKYLQTGSIMNYINVDVYSFYYFIMMSTFLFSAPFMILTAIVLLILQVGWLGLIAPILFFIGMFVQQIIMKKAIQLRKDQLYWADKRSKCVNQYFSGIRLIKYYGWQELVQTKIDNIRKEELSLNAKVLMIRTYIEVMMSMLPILSSIIIFALYDKFYGNLSPAKVYTVLSIFNLIATPMRLIIITLVNFINSKASLQRIQHFFGYQDKKLDGINNNDKNIEIGEIMMQSCIFNWSTKKIQQYYEKGKELYRKSPNEEKQKKQKKQQQKNKNKNKNKKIKQKQTMNLNQSMLTQELLNDNKEADYWQKQKQSNNALTIKKLNIPKGQFVGIIGRVGSGKSTLLSSILGQVDKEQGTISRRGSIAYIPQTSWLRSSTIRDNILFQAEYQEHKYNNILKICELQTDLSILGGGDLTQIGEKGVNLSGGQKQRISIARALYSDADIYLIDDCLSALDSYVAKNIFHHVLKGYLHKRGKTIVFITNALDYAQLCERIIGVQNGHITSDGTPAQLKQNDDYFLNLKLQQKKTNEKQQQQQRQKQQQLKQQKKKNQNDINLIKISQQQQQSLIPIDKQVKQEKKQKDVQGLVKVQERLKGSVPWRFYYRFFTGPGVITALIMFFFISIAQISRVASDWWLGQWSSNSFQLPPSTYIAIYASLSVVVGALMYLKGIFFVNFIVSSSRVIQRRLIQTLLKCPLSWFDVTPTGRILARTTKDQDDLDNSLSFNMQFSIQNILIMISSILLISLATPAYLIVAVFSGFVYYKLVGLYMSSSREIKRLEANTRAPLITHIQETINGIYVIRAFEKTDSFITKFYAKQKAYIVSLVNQNIATRWINLVTDLFSILTIAAAGYFGVLTTIINIGSSSSNLVGLALVWSLQISSILSFTLRLLADTQSNMNAVVRLYGYIDNNPSEKDFKQPKPQEPVWPSQGIYNINDISFKYRPELPNVIKKISFDIQSRSKIGVVGRTGSGKSTMTLGLLRILQLSQNNDGTKGSITLDNENISDIGLHHLRQNITIIPQDPILFTGTIKSNIDPFNKYSDEEIATSLQRVGIWEQIKKDQKQTDPHRQKIYTEVSDSGSNFSLGERQLICMARALIGKPKVLLMDEATASIDEKTDETIQKMIREQFTETTVITIAHRLNTIIYYDKILVLDHGQLKQYDTPLNLVQNQQSFLGKLIRKTGDSYAEKIITMAKLNN